MFFFKFFNVYNWNYMIICMSFIIIAQNFFEIHLVSHFNFFPWKN